MKSVGKVITITSRKGGVGKTTNLLNLAGVYSNLEKKIIILDFDLYTNSISVSLNLEPDKNIFNLVDDISNNRFKEFNNYVTKYNSNISVLASCKDPRQASLINLKYIEQIINYARYNYDVVLIDTSHVLMDLNIVIYDYSNTILNIMTNDPIDLVNTKSFINICKDINFSDLRILLNEGINLEEKYFSLYDIRSFLEYNISYRLNESFFVKTIDKYVLAGKVITLNKILGDKEYKLLEKIALDLLKEVNCHEK